MEESPAYRLNHEEVIKALEEGISFIETLEPEEAVPDEFGKLQAVRFLRGGSGEVVELPARTLPRRGRAPRRTSRTPRSVPESLPLDAEAALLRARTAPSPTGDGWTLVPAAGRRTRARSSPAISRGGKFVTFFGDNHPAYNGNVVKAMASAQERLRRDRRGPRRPAAPRGRADADVGRLPRAARGRPDGPRRRASTG